MDEPKEAKKTEQNFCILCGKYTLENLKNLQIGKIADVAVRVDACPRCEVVVANLGRIFGQVVEEIRKRQVAQEKKILTPGNEEGKILRPLFIPPKDIREKS